MQDNEIKIKVFDYHPQLDAFLCAEKYKKISTILGLNEWTPVVWMCRLFGRDQDFCEHTFDNWDEREKLEDKFKDQYPDINFNDLLIVCPERFTESDKFCYTCKNKYKYLQCPSCIASIHVGADGPCHSDEIKKLFWTDVFKSLEISYATMVAVAKSHSFILDVKIRYPDAYLNQITEEAKKNCQEHLEKAIEEARKYLLINNG